MKYEYEIGLNKREMVQIIEALKSKIGQKLQHAIKVEDKTLKRLMREDADKLQDMVIRLQNLILRGGE